MTAPTKLSITTKEAIGTVYERRQTSGREKPHKPSDWVFLNAGDGTGYKRCHHTDPQPETSDKPHRPQEWVTYWCRPHEALLQAWRLVFGVEPGHAVAASDWALSELCVRRWPDGRLILVGTPRNQIGSLFFECADSRVGSIEISVDEDTTDKEIRENIKALKAEIARRQFDRRQHRPMRICVGGNDLTVVRVNVADRTEGGSS